MSGSIVNRGLTQAHYNASKAGVIHLSKSLAMEWVDRGVRVNVISPGYTLTPMNIRPEVAEQRKIFAAETPMGRIATVEEMVGPAVFLLSPPPRSSPASTFWSTAASSAGSRGFRSRVLAERRFFRREARSSPAWPTEVSHSSAAG